MTVRQAFMVTLLYEVDATRTDIEVVSAVLIDSNALGKGLIKKSSTKNLIEYANRLAQEKP